MNDSSLTFFYDALIAARTIQKFCSNKSFEGCCSDDLLASAVERKFEIIRESLNRVKRKNAEDLSIVSEQLHKFISELEVIPSTEN